MVKVCEGRSVRGTPEESKSVNLSRSGLAIFKRRGKEMR
jgi:hypothetical protein